MLKRLLSLFLSIVMVLSCVPFQAFATEVTEEATEAVQIEETLAQEETLPEEPEAEVTEVTEAEVIETEETEPEVTETEATATEETEPEVTETEATEAEETEPEATEPEETEPEATESEATKSEETYDWLDRIPATRVEIRPETLTKTEDVRIVEVDENGNLRYHDTTETTSTTYMVAETVRNYPADAKSISTEGNWYTFETFEDLKQLCASGYSQYIGFTYYGEDPLVISEDLILPAYTNLYAWEGTVIINAGVTLETSDSNSGIHVDTLIVNGTYINRGWSDVSTRLEVNGTIKVYNSLSLGEYATVSGYENIQFVYDNVYLEKQFYTENYADFKAALAVAGKDTSGICYYISWSPAWDAESMDLVLEESVTIPANVRVSIGDYSEGTVTIAKGVTLEINSKDYSSLYGDVTVHGNLVNNGNQLSIGKSLTISSTGKYSGNGKIRHSTSDPNQKLEDWLFGMDLSNMDIQEERYPEYNYYGWTLRDVTGMPKLGTPKNLQWNKEYTWVYNEKKGTWEEKLVDHKGIMTWVPVEPDQGWADVTIYKEGDESWSDGGSWRFGVYGDLPPYRSVQNFVWGDYDSGTYYFTVRSMADDNNYRNSNIATSGTWTYVKPNKSLGTATNLTWDWPMVHWTTPDGASLECEVEFLYAPTANAEPNVIGGTWGATSEWGAEVFENAIQENGTGYYYFRVRPLSDDITKICNGTWSELSPAYNLDKTVENVKGQLDNISTKADDEEIRDTVQAMDTEELKSAMLADKGTEGVMDQLEKLETAVGGAAPVQVNEEVSDFDASKISIVGANLNDAAESSEEPITLVLDKPQEEHILDAAYDNAVAVSFSMTLENAADAENLEVPVKITLPVPANINPDFLVILHYKQNGQIEELTLGDVHVYREGNDTYASFVLTSFSDFVMTNLANNAVDSGVTGDVNWEVTTWGKLILSGEGGTDNYNEWNQNVAPWAEYADQITSVVVEDGITLIGEGAFEGLERVTEVSLPNTLTSIWGDAFGKCTRLKTVTIPASLMAMEYNAFTGCTALTEILVEEGSTYFTSVDGVLFYNSADGMKALNAYPAGKSVAVYIVPEDVDYIIYGAFKGAKNLTEVVLPENLSFMHGEVFEECSIETITLPAGINQILPNTFLNCINLKTIYFLGDFPQGEEDWQTVYDTAFAGVTATVYYPADNETWTEDKFQDYGGDLTWLPSDYIEITGKTEVLGGKSVKLTAKIMPENSAGNKIKWTLAEEDKEYASMKVSGNTATITAVDVSELHTITVTASSAEGIAPCSYELTIVPKTKELKLFEVWTDEDGNENESDLSWYDWWYFTLGEWSEGGFSTQLKAVSYPEGASSEVTWSSSNTKVATIDKNGVLSFTGKPGSTTVTATAKDGSGVKATAIWKAIMPAGEVEAVGDTEFDLLSGKSTTLKLRKVGAKNPISSKNIYWDMYTMDGSDASAYASITAAGKLTAKKIMEKVTIFVDGYVLTDGVYTACVSHTVNLYPATTHLELKYQLNKYNGETLPFDVTSEEPISITAELLPEDVMDVPVKWEINDNPKAKWVTDEETGLISKIGKYATYTINQETNELQISNPTGKAGTVTVKATAQDGSKKSASMKVQFAVYAKKVEILNEETELVSGKSLTLKAEASPENVTKKGITWFLQDPADKAYVTLSGNKLTAKAVYEEKTVCLRAESKDGSIGARFNITIKPKDPGMLVIHDAATEENVTKSTIFVNLSDEDREVLRLDARNYADGEIVETADWTWKSTKIADILEQDGMVEVDMKKAGSVTLTAKDGKRTATVTIKASKLADSISITSKDGKKNIIQDIYGQDMMVLASGKSLNLKATVKDQNGNAASSSKVTWSIPVGGMYATISSSGKLTAAKDLTQVCYVSVCATATDGSGAVGYESVMINPLATGIKIYTLEEDMEMRTINAYSNSWMNNRSNTNLVWDMAAVDENGETNDSFQIYSTVYPYYGERDNRNALQAVNWKSSSPKVATVSDDGEVTCLKPGTTTITATAADGSNQKISFKLTVVKRMHSITLPEVEVAGGKSITLKPIIEPADTTNKKLYWGIYGDTAFAKIDQKGKLTTKKVTSVKNVWIYAYAQDGSEVYTECKVTIYPKAATEVKLFKDGEKVTGQTIEVKVGETVNLMAECAPFGKASQNVTWKSSDAASVSVESGEIGELGIVTANKVTKKPITITATAADGSGKKATVKIKVVENQETLFETVTPGKLTVAISPDFFPMEFVDPTKEGQEQYVGFDVSLSKYIAESMGLELVIIPRSFEGCQNAVYVGDADISVSAFAWTEKFAKNYNLSDFYYAGEGVDEQCLITMAYNGDKFATKENLAGAKIGVQQYSLQQTLAAEQLPNSELILITDLGTAVQQLRNGELDCIAISKSNAEAIIVNNSEITYSGFHFVVDEKYTSNVILIRKGNDVMTEAVNAALASSKPLWKSWYEEAKSISGIEQPYDEEGNVIS